MDRTGGSWKSSLLAVGALVLLSPASRAGDVESGDCAGCHEDAGDFAKKISGSTHEGMECLDCHMSIEAIPHEEKVPAVECGMCHDEAAETYKWHGRLEVGKNPDIPSCSDCHGTHDVKHVADEDSKVKSVHLMETCGTCHEDIDLTTKHEILFEHPVEVFKSSVHGESTLSGGNDAALCNDCHSAGGSAHRILPPSNKESPINHFNIPSTCGKCHVEITEQYMTGIHGKLAARGETDAPVCTDCHGEHGILHVDDPRSPVSKTRLAQATCAPCHESARLNEKYGVPTGRLQTFIDTYHGLKSRAGDVTVANCASCHDSHHILPHTDPESSIHVDNLPTTCGHCHPGISTAMATAPIHGAPGLSQTPVANLIRKIYMAAIAVIIGLMALYILIDLRKNVGCMARGPQVRRMSRGELAQHWMLMLTFVTLVITGFSLRFSQSWWVTLLFGWEGGFPLRGVIHRVAAVTFVASALWHVTYLFTARGRRFLRDMLPRLDDFRHFGQALAYNLGLRKDRPLLGRFGYGEKFEYWALIWGSVAMVITGLMLWFDNYAAQWFPKGFLDVMLVIHYYEAWLATLSILIWHLYSAVFSPGVYPMNPSWLTGNMPRSMYEHEHPGETGD